MSDGNPRCKACRGSGVIFLQDSPSIRKAFPNTPLPGNWRCGCVGKYKAKLARKAHAILKGRIIKWTR